VFYPFAVQSQKDSPCRFGGIGYIKHSIRVQGIAPVAAGKVIKIDDVKSRGYLVILFVLKPGVVGNLRKVVKLKIVHKHAKALFDVLGNHMPYHEVGLASAGRA
jgi:hypothetical protein